MFVCLWVVFWGLSQIVLTLSPCHRTQRCHTSCHFLNVSLSKLITVCWLVSPGSHSPFNLSVMLKEEGATGPRVHDSKAAVHYSNTTVSPSAAKLKERLWNKLRTAGICPHAGCVLTSPTTGPSLTFD